MKKYEFTGETQEFEDRVGVYDNVEVFDDGILSSNMVAIGNTKIQVDVDRVFLSIVNN